MTKQEFKDKVSQIIKNDQAYIEKLVDKAINSGCMDIEASDDDLFLPHRLLTAVYKEMSREHKPFDSDKQGNKHVDKIYAHL